MFNLHLQNSVNNWTHVANAPGGIPSATKLVFGVERSLEVAGLAWYRWVGEQPLPHSGFEEHCERWLRHFIDDSFAKVSHAVDFVSGYNETLANSQSPEEKARWIELHTAMARVWHERFRYVPYKTREGVTYDFSHIRLTMCATAVGNDIPVEIAAACSQYNAVMDYHPYTPCRVGKIIGEHPDNEWSGINRPEFVSPHAWRWYDGRWEFMDEKFRSAGYEVDWIFGEGGPVLDASEDWSGWLDPLGGWKSPDCLNNSIHKYKQWVRYWLDNATRTHAYKTGRLLSMNLFTSGAPGDGQWDLFELRDGDMTEIFSEARAYPYPPQDGGGSEIPDGKPRVQYRRDYTCVPQDATMQQWLVACEKAYASRGTVGFSYDDAGIGALERKETTLLGIDYGDRQMFLNWFAEHYPGTKVTFGQLEPATSVPQVTLESPAPLGTEVTQKFGDNYEIYLQRYNQQGHYGIDYATPMCTPVKSAADGDVLHVGESPDDLGKYVIILHDHRIKTLYAHLDAVVITAGAEVTQGQVIGLSGDSGWSSGPHLHFSVVLDDDYVDPELFMGEPPEQGV